MRLYDLADQWNDLVELLENEADNEALQAMIDGLEGKIEEKVERILIVRQERLAEAEALKNEIARLTQRKQRAENDAGRLTKLTEYAMVTIGKEKIKTLRFNTWLQNNAPSCEIYDESLIPQEWIRRTEVIAPDKKGMLELLKQGEQIPGVALKQTQSLRVR